MYKLLVPGMCLLLSGCTSMLQAMSNDPVRVTNIASEDRDRGKDVAATVSLDAGRRNVIVVLTGPNQGKFCAEPPPEVAKEIETSLVAQLKAEAQTPEGKKAAAEGKVEDKYKDKVIILAERTTLLDIYRTGTYSLCQLHLNGALSATEVKELFSALTLQVLEQVPPKK